MRKPDIIADATLALVTKEPSERTGKALLDEEVLRADGITDFKPYRCDPATEPVQLDFETFQKARGIGKSPHKD